MGAEGFHGDAERFCFGRSQRFKGGPVTEAIEPRRPGLWFVIILCGRRGLQCRGVRTASCPRQRECRGGPRAAKCLHQCCSGDLQNAALCVLPRTGTLTEAKAAFAFLQVSWKSAAGLTMTDVAEGPGHPLSVAFLWVMPTDAGAVHEE